MSFSEMLYAVIIGPIEPNKTTFISGNWYSVHSDVRNPANWKLLTTDSLSPFGDE